MGELGTDLSTLPKTFLDRQIYLYCGAAQNTNILGSQNTKYKYDYIKTIDYWSIITSDNYDGGTEMFI